MVKKTEETLEKQLRNIQILLGKPGVKIVGTLFYYLNFLNPLGKVDKGPTEEEKKGSIETQEFNGITWVDVENPTRAEVSRLAQDYPFHPLHLEACLLKGQPVQVEKESDYIFVLLHSPSYDASVNRVVTDEICIFLGKNYLVTVHSDKSPEVRSLFNLCKADKQQREAYFKKSSSFLLYNVIDNQIKELFDLTQTISQELDEIEDIVFDVKTSGIFKISNLRQKIVRLRRITVLFKKILVGLSASSSASNGENMSRYYRNLAKTIDKLWESLEEAKQTIEIYKDADFTASSEKTNQILAVLTIIFTLAIPATVIGTFYGMNIFLPGGIESGAWKFWGEYTTLKVVLIVSTIPAVLMFWYFRYKNWF